MRSSLFQSSPEFKTRQSHLLNVILLVTLVINALDMFVIVLFIPDFSVGLPVNLTAFVAQLFLLFLLHRGYVQIASVGTVFIFWLVVALGMMFTQGLHNSLHFVSIIVILTAGLLFGGYGAFLLAFLLGVIGFLTFVIHATSISVFNVWFISTSTFFIAALLLFLADREIKLTFARLRESEERYRQLFEFSPVATFVSTTDGQILEVNPAGVTLLGAKDAQDLTSHNWRDFRPPQTDKIVEQRLQDYHEGKKVSSTEYQLYRVDKQLIDVEVNGLQISYEDHPAILGVIKDMTEQNRIQAERVRAELLHMELSKEKELADLRSNFITRVSHEFRTPLTVILSSKEILETYFDRLSPEKRQDHLQKIGRQVQFLTEMLDDILLLNRANSGLLEFKPAVINLQEFIKTLIADQPKIEMTVLGDNFQVAADKKLLHPIFSNLISNAIKYSPDGGKVKISLRSMPGELIIQVSDQGIGIPADDLPHLFTPFHRASNTGAIPGAGLGLAIVKNCVEAHKGTITCVSEEGKGTTFTVCLIRSGG